MFAEPHCRKKSVLDSLRASSSRVSTTSDFKREVFSMLPIGPLMIEHRLIERIIKVMKEELHRMKTVANILELNGGQLFGKRAKNVQDMRSHT